MTFQSTESDIDCSWQTHNILISFTISQHAVITNGGVLVHIDLLWKSYIVFIIDALMCFMVCLGLEQNRGHPPK